MRLLYLNPNSTASMTDQVTAVARAALPEAEVLGWTNLAGPPAIQGPEDGAAAVIGLMAMLPAAREVGADVIIIACFDDTGLDDLRAAAHCPVIGIGQAAYVTAALAYGGFAVVTTLQVSVPVLEENIARYGLSPPARRCWPAVCLCWWWNRAVRRCCRACPTVSPMPWRVGQRRWPWAVPEWRICAPI